MKYIKDMLGLLLLALAELFGKFDRSQQNRGRRSRRQERRRTMILRWKTAAGLAVCALVFLAGAVKLIGYGFEHLSAAISSHQLRQMYYESETAAPIETPLPTAQPTAAQQTAAVPQQTPAAVPVIEPSVLPALAADPQGTDAPQMLETVHYPNNRSRSIDSRFRTIRQQNTDIIGWLTIKGLLDEAVVQRDNIYYMTHDYLGKENANGAIFLDEIISLNHRPYTLILYGHNMKTGAMFGGLRNYENQSFHKTDPFIRFNSIYEEGVYVIFSVGTVSVDPNAAHYLDIGKLVSNNVANRSSVLSLLRDTALYETAVPVKADDQVLLLVTCVGDANERRVVAARRLREDETQEEVARQVRWGMTW